MLRRDSDDRWAATFGLIAGYSFAVAAVTGVLLLPFFRPSMATVIYHGSYAKLNGVPVSQAFRSVLAISFDVHGGLLIRQVHHWSAGVFVADQWITGERPPLRLLPPRPVDPVNRIAAGVACVTFYGLLWAASANDQIAYHLHLDLYTVTWSFRALMLAGPALAFLITRVICHALVDRRRDEELHGRETGRIVMNSRGGYTEIREPAQAPGSTTRHWTSSRYEGPFWPHPRVPHESGFHARCA